MKKYRLIITFLIVIVPKLSLAKINIEVTISPITNLIRHLDCASGSCNHCAPVENYRQLWNTKFIHSNIDREMVDKWKEVITKYSRERSLLRTGERTLNTNKTANARPQSPVRSYSP